ncbi:hypothetical protein GDO81_029005 [Engystomops pustulosus]|uniref:Uncharacterized protein n=1 Tax=Engystomops pustulosus TaxID=76066 RepID=A0AAV6YN87_ENGPU|nr:hypothetical protein GDO81_029005 [Engystomops pustulosus]
MAISCENDTNIILLHDLFPSGLSDVFITYRNTSAIILWGTKAFIDSYNELLQQVSICSVAPSSSGPLQFSLAALITFWTKS